MKENDYYQKGYNLGKLRAKDLTNSEDNSRQVSEMMDSLMYQSESFKIFSIGFINGWVEAKEQEQNDRKE